MAPSPVAALSQGVLGTAAAGAGVLSLGWAALAKVKIERGFEAMMWAAQNAPVPLGKDPVQFANDMVQDKAILGTGAAGVFLCALGFSLLRAARVSWHGNDLSNSGKASLELATTSLRGGGLLEGHLVLKKRPKADQLYRLTLACRREVPRTLDRSGPYTTETHFSEDQVSRPVERGGRWVLPFRFRIPVTAPASQGGFGGYRWRLEFARADAWVSFYDGFDLAVAAASPAELQRHQASIPPASDAEIAALKQRLDHEFGRALPPGQEEVLRRMTPEARRALSARLEQPGRLPPWAARATGTLLLLSFVAFSVFMAGAVMRIW